jgi:ribosomal protein S12
MAKVQVDNLVQGNLVMHDHDDYLPLSGGTLTGNVAFPVSGFTMRDSNGVRYQITINTSGEFVITEIVATAVGSPWLWMFGTV